MLYYHQCQRENPLKTLYKDEDIKNTKNLFYLPFKRRSIPTIDHSSFLLLDKLIIIHFTSFFITIVSIIKFLYCKPVNDL